MIEIKADKAKEKTLLGELIFDEGYRKDPYEDTKDKITGGVGHLMSDQDRLEFKYQWDDQKKEEYWMMKLQEDLVTTEAALGRFKEQYGVATNETQDEVLFNMMFNLGPTGVSKFKEMIKGLQAGDINKAADEMIDSDWHKDFVKWNAKGGGDTPAIRSRRLEAKMRDS
jgi:GH24 family phage-related lysozyme (muramidase)